MFAGLALYASEKDLIGLYYSYESSEEQLVVLQDDIEGLELTKLQLERAVSGLDTVPLLRESAIRKNTGDVREGDTIYLIKLPAGIKLPSDE